MVILDTCALIDFCKKKPAVSKASYDLFEQKGATILSVSFAEIALKIKQKKLLISCSARELFDYFRQIADVNIVDIGCEEWFQAVELDWNHKDPVDRVLVAYARRLDIPIVTTDKEIKKYYKKVIW